MLSQIGKRLGLDPIEVGVPAAQNGKCALAIHGPCTKRSLCIHIVLLVDLFLRILN